jgi:hypothetical protein
LQHLEQDRLVLLRHDLAGWLAGLLGREIDGNSLYANLGWLFTVFFFSFRKNASHRSAAF